MGSINPTTKLWHKKKIFEPATQAEIVVAIAKFLASGGIIQQLPPEEVPINCRVGFTYGTYEPIPNYEVEDL